MAGFIIAVIVIVIIVAVSRPGGGYDGLIRRGLPARGILLAVAPRGTKTGTPQRRFEQRMVTIDVEIPGRQPYVIDAQPYIPINLVRDVLPGATVELRVDRRNPARIAIVGPGAGFAVAQLNAGVQQ